MVKEFFPPPMVECIGGHCVIGEKGLFLRPPSQNIDTPESYKSPVRKKGKRTLLSASIFLPSKAPTPNFHLPSPFWGLSCPSLNGDCTQIYDNNNNNDSNNNITSLSPYSISNPLYIEQKGSSKKEKKYNIKTDEMVNHHMTDDVFSSFSDLTISLSKEPFRYPRKLILSHSDHRNLNQHHQKLVLSNNYIITPNYYSILVNLLIPFTKSYPDTSIDTAYIALGILVQFPSVDISLVLVCSLMIAFKFQEEEDLTTEEIQQFIGKRLKSFQKFSLQKVLSTEFFIFSKLSFSLNRIIRPSTLVFRILDHIDLCIMNIGPGVKVGIVKEFLSELPYLQQQGHEGGTLIDLLIDGLINALQHRIKGDWTSLLRRDILF